MVAKSQKPEIIKIYSVIQEAVRKGKMKREKCESCGGNKFLRFHHEDYSKPLEVICLCGSCHARLHSSDPETFMPIYVSLFEKKKLSIFPKEKEELVELFIRRGENLKLYLEMIKQKGRQKLKRNMPNREYKKGQSFLKVGLSNNQLK